MQSNMQLKQTLLLIIKASLNISLTIVIFFLGLKEIFRRVNCSLNLSRRDVYCTDIRYGDALKVNIGQSSIQLSNLLPIFPNFPAGLGILCFTPRRTVQIICIYLQLLWCYFIIVIEMLFIHLIISNKYEIQWYHTDCVV